MRLRLGALIFCLGVLGVSARALPQSAPPAPPAVPPMPAIQGGRGGVTGGIGAPQTGRNTQPPPPLVATGLIVGRVIDPGTGRGVPNAIVTLNGGPSRTTAPVAPGGRPAPPAPPPPPPQVLTDSEGRFAFLNLTRGTYTLSASKSGYAAGAYGRMRPSGPSRSLQLDDGEKIADANLRLFKFGSISGTVIDDAGEPLVASSVRVYRRVLMSGRRVLVPGSQTQTDDRGAYRIGNLTPGEYVVVVPVIPVTVPGSVQIGNRANLQASTQNIASGIGVVPNAGGQTIGADARFVLQRNTGGSADVAAAPGPDGRVLGFATMYYPNAPTAAGAQPIPLASGEERTSVDLAMRRVPTVALSGQVLAHDGPGADYVIRLIRTDTGDVVQEPEAALAMSDSAGSFMFLAVPAGQYVLQVVRTPRPAPPPEVVARASPTAVTPAPFAPTAEPLLWAMTPVSVSDTDVHGIAVTLREGLTVSGRLEFSGSRPRPNPQALSQIPIVIEAADGRQQQQFNSGPPSRVQSDGRFITTGQLPGRYFLRVAGGAAGWSVQSIMAGGVDVTDSPIDLTTGSIGNVVITFTDLVQDVRGTVTGVPSGGDPPFIVVFPADSTAWKNFGVNPLRMRSTRVSPAGTFAFGSLPAGDYFAASFPEEYSSEWQDPAYLELLTRTATRFSLNPGERKTLDIPMHDVKPPGIGREVAPAPVATVAVPIPPIPDERLHGPFVAAGEGDDAPQQTRDTRPATTAVGGGSISGVVRIDDGSLRPARFARVSARTPNLPGERLALTDDEGRYAFSSLPPGTYQITVTKPAYLTMTYGARRPLVSNGVPIKVAAGQSVTGIDVVLKRGGVVTGSVLNADGEPAQGVRVQLLQRVLSDGEPRLIGGPGSAMTDDRGQFRMYGVRPGSYALLATPTSSSQQEIRQLSDQEIRAAFAEAAAAHKAGQQPVANRSIPPAPPGPLPTPPPPGRPVGFAPVYYPGTIMEEDAGVFTVGPGTESSVSLMMQMVPTARIEGTVRTADGQPAPIAGLNLTLQRAATFSSSNASVRMTDVGTFLAMGVAPGRYVLTARFNEQAARPPAPPVSPQVVPAATTWHAQQEIDVTGVDLSGISLVLAPPLTITGRVIFDGAPPPDTQIQVRLDSAGRALQSSFARVVRPGATGEFTITGVPPGRYRVNASAIVNSPAPAPGMQTAPAGWALKSAIVDGRDAMEKPFDLQSGRAPQSVIVTMSMSLPQLSATITDKQNEPISNMTFVLFSQNREYWTGQSSRRVRSQTRPTEDGQYLFTSILPGDYYLVVLTELEPTDLYDPQFLEQLIPAAVKITLNEGDKKVQNLRIAG